MSGVFATKKRSFLFVDQKKQNKRIPADLSRSEEKDDRIRGREEKMKETGRIKLKEIPFSRTFETGYESAFYFSKVFKKVTGLSPREYQQSI